jgi:glucan phosphoethanolaminetransferase (alkaline phosphatase superfamily)
MNEPDRGQSARCAPRGHVLAFNLFFWLGFWLSPVVVQAMEQWPEVSLIQCLIWLKQGVVFTAGMAALAEVFGKHRRFYYLGAGFLMWVGAVISTVFLATTGITANAFTALTGIVYSGPDDAGLRYLVITQRDLVGVVIATCPFLLLLWCWRALRWQASVAAFAGAASACIVITVFQWLWHDYGPRHALGANKLDTIGTFLDPAAPVTAYVEISRALPLAHAMMLKPGRPPPKVRAPALQRPLTIIVVVGESTTRNHMGLYGYCRDTTPVLSKSAADLFIFKNTISEIPMTVFALSNGFRVELDSAHGHPDQSVFDVFNAANFHTYWLTNQFDYPGDPVSSLTHGAQHRIATYQGKKNNAEYKATLDETLLAPLDAVLTGDPASKIIFLHTVGTHSLYQERVPDGFLPDAYRSDALNRDAAKRNTIDAYDRAVRYLDMIVGKVISRAGNQAGDVAVIYFSDHGDEVFDYIDFVGHRYPRSTQDMVEIPLLVWLSPDMRVAQPALVAALNAGLSQKMDIRDISPLLLDIAGIDVDGLSEQRRPLGGSFMAQRRLVGGEDYDHDPTLGIARQLPALDCQCGRHDSPRPDRGVPSCRGTKMNNGFPSIMLREPHLMNQ